MQRPVVEEQPAVRGHVHRSPLVGAEVRQQPEHQGGKFPRRVVHDAGGDGVAHAARPRTPCGARAATSGDPGRGGPADQRVERVAPGRLEEQRRQLGAWGSGHPRRGPRRPARPARWRSRFPRLPSASRSPPARCSRPAGSRATAMLPVPAVTTMPGRSPKAAASAISVSPVTTHAARPDPPCGAPGAARPAPPRGRRPPPRPPASSARSRPASARARRTTSAMTVAQAMPLPAPHLRARAGGPGDDPLSLATMTAVLVPPASTPTMIRLMRASSHGAASVPSSSPVSTVSTVPRGTYQGQASFPLGASTNTVEHRAAGEDHHEHHRHGTITLRPVHPSRAAREQVGTEQRAVGDRGDRQREDHHRRLATAGGGVEDQRHQSDQHAPDQRPDPPHPEQVVRVGTAGPAGVEVVGDRAREGADRRAVGRHRRRQHRGDDQPGEAGRKVLDDEAWKDLVRRDVRWARGRPPRSRCR